jgi:hypothetical protein
MDLQHKLTDADDSIVREWRVTQLRRLGVPDALAEVDADYADWHQVARLVQRGCSPELAMRIVR